MPNHTHAYCILCMRQKKNRPATTTIITVNPIEMQLYSININCKMFRQNGVVNSVQLRNVHIFNCMEYHNV